MTDPFSVVGIRRPPEPPVQKKRPLPRCPWAAVAVLGVLILGCLAAPVIAPGDAGFLDMLNTSRAPCAQFPFGTDAMGRDIFRCIWHGGRVSMVIGFLSALISAAIGILYGSISGCAAPWVDRGMMRLVELLLSVPELLMILFLQAFWGRSSPLSISVIIGITSWYQIAKVVRTQVRQLRASEFVIAARALGGSFRRILVHHLMPNFLPSIAFMVVMNVRAAIATESTLSFLGMGLGIETVSWGSLLSQAQRALLTGSWWVILIPGGFLVALLLSLTEIGNWLRTAAGKQESNL